MPESRDFYRYRIERQPNRCPRLFQFQCNAPDERVLLQNRCGKPLRCRLDQFTRVLLHPLRDKLAYLSVIRRCFQLVRHSGTARFGIHRQRHHKFLAKCRLLRINAMSCKADEIFNMDFIIFFDVHHVLFSSFLFLLAQAESRQLIRSSRFLPVSCRYKSQSRSAQLKQMTCLILVKRIFAIRFATCRIIRDPPASGSFLMIFHNRVAASQLIRSGLYHS